MAENKQYTGWQTKCGSYVVMEVTEAGRKITGLGIFRTLQ